ncbi:MAG: hypothetical protein KME31_14795 [Tolypothrix carrinoi HA7290-LM1]|nr:hypothetical protein [Tolypothrix carrinoi HA7290-LM1]
MVHGEGEWGRGGEWGTRRQGGQGGRLRDKGDDLGDNFFLLSIPNAQCPMPNAQCPMPHAPCPFN